MPKNSTSSTNFSFDILVYGFPEKRIEELNSEQLELLEDALKEPTNTTIIMDPPKCMTCGIYDPPPEFWKSACLCHLKLCELCGTPLCKCTS